MDYADHKSLLREIQNGTIAPRSKGEMILLFKSECSFNRVSRLRWKRDKN